MKTQSLDKKHPNNLPLIRDTPKQDNTKRLKKSQCKTVTLTSRIRNITVVLAFQFGDGGGAK